MSTITAGKTAGAPASNQHGEFKVHYCSPAQAKFIQQLLDQRMHGFKIDDASKINKRHASRIIEQLLSCPKIESKILPASEKQVAYIESLIASRANARLLLSLPTSQLNRDQAYALITNLTQLPMKPVELEVGAYLHDGIVYSVRQVNKESKRLRAYEFNHEYRKWVVNFRIINEIKPEERLTLKQASEFGAQTGCCCHCGRTLTVRKSIVAGMGKICASRYN